MRTRKVEKSLRLARSRASQVHRPYQACACEMSAHEVQSGVETSGPRWGRDNREGVEYREGWQSTVQVSTVSTALPAGEYYGLSTALPAGEYCVHCSTCR